MHILFSFHIIVVIPLEIVLDDERHDVVLQALFEKEQTSDSAVAVPGRMDALKAAVETKQIDKCLRRIGMLVDTLGLFCRFGYIPRFAAQKCAVDLSIGTVSADAALETPHRFAVC